MEEHSSNMRSKKGFRGVFKCGKKFKAQIQVHGVQTYLGLFDDEVEAAKAYDAHARINLGPRARTNFPNNKETKASNAFVSNIFLERPRSRNKRLYCGIKKNPPIIQNTIPTVSSCSSVSDDQNDEVTIAKRPIQSNSAADWKDLHLVEDFDSDIDSVVWAKESIDGDRNKE